MPSLALARASWAKPKAISMFQIRLPLLFGDLLFDLFQHNVIKCISVDSDIMYISSWACSNANLHTCTVSRGSQWIQARQLVFQPVELVQGYFAHLTHSATQTRAQNIQTNAPSLCSTRRMCWQNCWLRTAVSLYLTRAIGPLSSNKILNTKNVQRSYFPFSSMQY